MKPAAALHVLPMSGEDRTLAVKWLSGRIRKHTGRNDLVFPADWMPQSGLGAWDENGTPLAFAALCLEKSCPVAVCSWCTANPGNSPRESANAIRRLLGEMPLYARSQGAKYLMTTFGNRAINHILDTMHFLPGEKAETKIKLL